MNQSDDQQSMIENAPDTEALADLPLTGEQDEETKAGPSHSGGGGGGAGKVSMRDFAFTMK